MFNKCAIIINGYFSNESTVHQTESLKRELISRGYKTDVIKNNAVTAFIDGGEVETNLKGYDFIIYLDKDLHIAKMLEYSGLRLFNSAKAIELCDDKMLTFTALLGSGINFPKTISAPIMYSATEDEKFLKKVINIIPFPIVVKKVHGSMGKQVYLAKNYGELKEVYETLKTFPHVYEEYIGDGTGRDIRVITVGGKAVAAMERINKNDFRSNVELGGRGYPIKIEGKAIEIAEKVSKLLSLDYAGVDVLEKDGNYYLCEVNSNAFFKGIESVTGIDVAKIYVDHVLKSVLS